MPSTCDIAICSLIVKQILSFASNDDINMLKQVRFKYVIRKGRLCVCIHTSQLKIYISKHNDAIIGKYDVDIHQNQLITKRIVLYNELYKCIINSIRE